LSAAPPAEAPAAQPFWLRDGSASVALAVALALGGALALDTEALVAHVFFWDDEFYYFQVARNVAAGRGFSFDGLSETNGFQPLWLFLLVPLFGVLPGDDLPLRGVVLLEVCLIVGAAVLVFRGLRGRLGAAPAMVAALLLVAQPGATRVFRVGLETSLVLLLLVVAWRRWLSLPDRAGARTWLGLGVVCALAFLARLEAALLVPAILWLARGRRDCDRRAVAALLGPLAACAVVYLAWNQLAFGSWLPVSGMVKMHWAWVGSPWDLPGLGNLLLSFRIPWFGDRLVQRLVGIPFISGPATLLDVGLLALVAAVAWKWRARVVEAVRRAGAQLLLLNGALMVLLDKLVLRHMMVEWQEVPVFLATAVLGGALLIRTPRLARWAAPLALAACVARAPLAAWHTRDPGGHVTHYVIEAARWLETSTAPGERVAAWRWGGTLGYFSHRPVTILDGLANSSGYFRRVVQRGDIEGYLRDERIGWLAGPSCGPSPSFAETFPAALLPADTQQRLRREFELAAHFRRAGAECLGFTLWRKPTA
jgi:hypothetical protein